MTPVSLNDYLNINNPWTKRLLGLSDFQKKRDIKQIENEYNLDKYGKLMEFDLPTMEDYKRKEFELGGLSMDSKMIISFGENLFQTSVADMRNHYYHIIKRKVDQYRSTNLCELGCGFGFNLSLFDDNVTGGEYSKNAVKLGQKLDYDVREFNYYNESDYDFILPYTTVFTVHSMEQIPDSTAIINNLEKQKHKINYVVHFEPTVLPERTTLFGLLRNKYMELNDYNRNLIPVLKQHPNIEILEMQTDIFGLNPLNSSNLIVWKFKH